MNEKERIEQLMASEGMNARQFAEEVGIQAGTLSNIFNNRNKPSLEVLQRILNRFRMVSSDWLILGVGSMYRQKNDSQPLLFEVKPEIEEQKPTESQGIMRQYVMSKEPIVPTHVPMLKKQAAPVVDKQPRRIQKIAIFYDDGTYEEIVNN